jgi:hypothetical protein
VAGSRAGESELHVEHSNRPAQTFGGRRGHAQLTKAAQFMGVTQPAVSSQIKRLQYLLGYEVLDKSAPGVS